MLALGKSKPWPKALKELTGSEDVDPKALLRYFKPLIDWMKKQRMEKGYPYGWTAPKEPTKAPPLCDSGNRLVYPALFSTVLSVFFALKSLF